MACLNMRFGALREAELMATVQECSNWGLALVSGQTTTLFNVSAEENNTFTGWLRVQRLHTSRCSPSLNSQTE